MKLSLNLDEPPVPIMPGGTAMSRLSSNLIARFSPTRALMYRALVAQPDAQWSVRSLRAALPVGADITLDTVRAGVYLLLADGLVDLVSGCNVLTVRLTEIGRLHLPAILSNWHRPDSGADT